MGRGLGSYVLKQDKDRIKGYKLCFYCLSYCENVVIEHIHPLIKGGNSRPENITGACNRCNSYKSDFSVSEFCERMFVKRDKEYYNAHKLTRLMRRIKNKPHEELMFIEYASKLKKCRLEHSYYTNIIHSIENNLYMCNVVYPKAIWLLNGSEKLTAK